MIQRETWTIFNELPRKFKFMNFSFIGFYQKGKNWGREIVEWVLKLPFSYRNWARIKIHSLRHSLASSDTNFPDLLLGSGSSFQKQAENPQKTKPRQLKPWQRSKMFWGVRADSSTLHLVLAKQPDCASCASTAPSPLLPAGLTGTLHLLRFFLEYKTKCPPLFGFFFLPYEVQELFP